MAELTTLLDKDQLMEDMEDMQDMNEEFNEVDQMMADMGVAQDDPDVLAMYEDIEAGIVEEELEDANKAGDFVPVANEKEL